MTPSSARLLGRMRWPECLLVALLLLSVWQNFWIMDDAFVYFRYVDNLLWLGRGLVFNAGEFIEGYTSPLWLLVLIPWRATGLDFWTISLALGLICASGFAWAAIRLCSQLQPAPAFRINIPLAVAATHYGVTSHFTSGLETPLVQLWSVLFALWCLRPASPALQVAGGVAPLVRPELALLTFLGGINAFLRARHSLRPLVLSALAANGAWLSFRIYYYAELLPNTFFLKSGTDWSQGLNYLLNELHRQWWALALVPAWFLSRPDGDQRQARTLMVVAAGLWTVWVVRIGGDMLYHRFLAGPFVLLLCALGSLSWTPRRPALAGPVPAAAAMILLALAASFSYPPQLDGHPWTVPEQHQWNHIEDPAWHRRHHQLSPGPQRPSEDAALRRSYRQTTAHPTGAMKHPWCRRAFFEPEMYIVHSLGLTSNVLARLDVPLARPGHKRLGRHVDDLLRIVQAEGFSGRRGMFRHAVEVGASPPWVRRQLESLEVLERKAYNRHDFAENVTLALQSVGALAP